MSPDPPRRSQLSSSGARVHSDGLSDDEAIGYELADCLTGVGVGDFVHFVRIEPNLALATAYNGGRKALLGTEVDPSGDSTR